MPVNSVMVGQSSLPRDVVAALLGANSPAAGNVFLTEADQIALSPDILAALNGANAPSAINVFATMADVGSLGLVPATRTISVSGLGLSGGGNLSADRTITLASSSAPGAAAAVLATNALGGISLAGKAVLALADIGSLTDYAEITATGTLLFHGAATYWLDEKGVLSGAKLVSPGGKVYLSDTESAYGFKDNAVLATDYIWVNVQFNHDRKKGVAFSPHLHWWQTSANVPNWLIEYRYQKQGSAKVTAWSNVRWVSHAFAYVSGTLDQITEFTDITPPAGDGISDILQVRLARDTTNASGLFGADPFVGDVLCYDFDCHKNCDKLGSDDEYSNT